MRDWNIDKVPCEGRLNQGWRSSFHSAAGSLRIVQSTEDRATDYVPRGDFCKTEISPENALPCPEKAHPGMEVPRNSLIPPKMKLNVAAELLKQEARWRDGYCRGIATIARTEGACRMAPSCMTELPATF